MAGGDRWPEVVAGGGGGGRGRRLCPMVAVAGGGGGGGAGGRWSDVVVVAEGHFCHLERIHGRNGEIHHFWKGMVNSLN